MALGMGAGFKMNRDASHSKYGESQNSNTNLYDYNK